MTENNFKIDSAAITDRGLSKKRPQNEDSFLEMNQRGLFAVADGVGGAQAGDVASQMAMEILGEAFTNLKPNEDAEELMKIAIERANEAIYQMSRDLPQLATMATTIVALHLAGNIATIGHVGDSRLYLLDGKGDLFRKTDDHSVVEEEVRAGRMTVAQAANHPSRNVILRALGAENTVNVELKTIMFEPNTTFLLCSDGITRHIDDFELRELLISPEDPAEICQKMKEICYQRGAEDNLTAVIARVSDVVARVENVPRTDYGYPIEESTVASARTSSTTYQESPNILDLGDEFTTQKLQPPVSHDLPPIELEVTQEMPFVENEYEPVSSELFDEEFESTDTKPPVDTFRFDEQPGEFETNEDLLPAETESLEKIAPDEITSDADTEAVVIPDVEVSDTVKEYDVKSYDLPESVEPGFLSKFLGNIFLFLIGLVIGGGAIYMFSQGNPPEKAEQPLPVQTYNIPLTNFEELRRTVDDNPEKYIKESAVLPDKDAEDYFLLGRAYMLTGNYSEAKKALEEAKKGLGEVNENNATVIADDIASYLAIIANSGAQKLYAEELKKINAEPDSKTDANQAAAPENRPQN